MKVDYVKIKELSQYPNEYKSSTVFAVLARWFAWILIHTRITPNQITWMWGGMMLISALCYSTGEYWYCIIGGILWICAYALDYTDGIVARYKNQKSPRGKFLDMVNHLTTYPILMFCIGWGVYIKGGSNWFHPSWFLDEYYIFFGIVTGVSIVLILSVMGLYEECKASASKLNPESEPKEARYESGKGSAAVEGQLFKNPSLFKKVMEFNPLIFTTMMLMLLVFAILDQMAIFIILYGLGYGVAIIIRVIMLYRDL